MRLCRFWTERKRSACFIPTNSHRSHRLRASDIAGGMAGRGKRDLGGVDDCYPHLGPSGPSGDVSKFFVSCCPVVLEGQSRTPNKMPLLIAIAASLAPAPSSTSVVESLLLR